MRNCIDSTKSSPLTRKQQLEKMELFAGISADALEELAGLMKEVSFQKNNLVITQGEKTRSLFIITAGRMKVFASDEEGNQTIFTFLGESDFFGELSLLDDAPRSASVITVEASKALNLSQENFCSFFGNHPEICQPLFRSLTTRIRKMDEMICILTSRDTYGRLIQALYQEAQQEADGKLITPRLTHQDLSEMIGSSREMISRIFKELKQGDYISVEQKRIVINKKLPSRW